MLHAARLWPNSLCCLYSGGDAEPGVDPTYINLFLLKYVCPNPECGGTLAPELGTDRYECNMCGLRRSEADFLAELQQTAG